MFSYSVDGSVNAGGRVTLAYDDVVINGTNATLSNPRLELYARSGFRDANGFIEVGGTAVQASRVYDSARDGTLYSGTRTWPLASLTIPLSSSSVTTRTMTVRIANIYFFNGDAADNTYTWEFDLPKIAAQVGQTKIVNVGALRERYYKVELVAAGGAVSATAIIPNNGKTFYIRALHWNDSGSGATVSVERALTRALQNAGVPIAEMGISRTLARGVWTEITVPGSTLPLQLKLTSPNGAVSAIIQYTD